MKPQTKSIARIQNRMGRLIIVGVLALTARFSVQADPIPTLFNTGVDTNRVALPAGAIDPHYIITVNSDNSLSSDAFVHIEGFPIVPGVWLANTTISKWIAPRADSTMAAGGDYTYELTFDLTNFDPTTASITGNWATDNGGVDILINGISTGNANNNGFSVYTPFSITNGFSPGLNTIDFEVNNQGVGWTGLRVELSGTATPVISTPPGITVQPVSQCIGLGADATFSVTAFGNPAPTYQWRKNGTGIGGATSASFTISPVASGDAGGYDVVVTNPSGSITSVVATLTVGVALVNPSFEADTFANFPGYVTGNGPITGWNALGGHGINPGVGFSPFADNGTIPNGKQVAFMQQAGAMSQAIGGFTMGADYFVRYFENKRTSDGSPASLAATIDDGVNPTITIVPSHAVPSVGGVSPYLQVTSDTFKASGTNLTLSFVKSNPQGCDDTALIDYVCVIPVAPNTVPTILQQPQPLLVQVGDSASFTAQSQGSLPFSYQWRKNGNNINGATDRTFTINSALTTDAGDYSVVVSNGAGKATSADAHLTVFEAIPDLFNTGVDNNRGVLADGAVDPHYQIVTNADSASLDAIIEDSTVFPIGCSPWVANTSTSKWIGPSLNTGLSAGGDYAYETTFTVPADRDPSTIIIIGQWASDNLGSDILVNGVSIGSGNNNQFISYTTFTIASSNATLTTGVNTIDFLVNNAAQGYTGLRVDLKSHLPIPPGTRPTIVGQPQGQKATVGDTVILMVSATGTAPLSYQWSRDGIPLAGQTSKTLTLTGVTPADSGDYTVTVSNATGMAVSDPATVCVCLRPIAGVFGTGVDDNHALLANGATDPHYILAASAELGPDAFVVIDGQFPIPPWLMNGPNSKWIAPMANQTNGNAPGSYAYQTSFDLTGFDPTQIQLVGQWAVDNAGMDILVNGTSTGITSPGFGSFTPFTITNASGLVPGANVLEFDMNNAGSTPNPTGLRVDLRGLVPIGPYVRITRLSDGRLSLSWACTNATQVLQTAPTVLGPWTAAADQSNPQIIVPCTHTVALNAAQEVPPNGGRTGSGFGTITLSGTALTFNNITYSGLSGTVANAHIHGPALPGQIGNVLYPLIPTYTSTGGHSGSINGTLNLVAGTGGWTIAQQLDQLNTGQWYINIHTSPTFGGGEIRGQIQPRCAQFFQVRSP
jgi:hypothetical protein